MEVPMRRMIGLFPYACRLFPLALVLRVIVVLFALGQARLGVAACNLIPSASTSFRSTLGFANRPFAAPGDFVEVGVDPTSRCAAASSGLSTDVDDHVVTLVFTPPGHAPHHVLVLTTADCGTLASSLQACGATSGVAKPPVCRRVNQAGATDLAVVERAGVRRLAVRFPD